MSWRLAERLSVAVLAVLVVIVLLVLLHGTSQGDASALQGTDLGSVPAPDVRLTDQLGQPISLAQFRGHPVILTFLYTHCPDVCPLIADRIHLSLEPLGGAHSQVGVLSVSTDPKGDDQVAAYHFSQVYHVLYQVHFLIGTSAALGLIWAAYHVSAAAATPTAASLGTASHYSSRLSDRPAGARTDVSWRSFHPREPGE